MRKQQKKKKSTRTATPIGGNSTNKEKQGQVKRKNTLDVMEQEQVPAMPRAILRVICGERNTGLFSDGMTEKKRGTGMGYPEMTSAWRSCVSFYLVLSIWFFLSICQSVYWSFCFLWFLRLSSGWMISRWMNSVGDLCIYEA
jgi:hypothetical protein